ncbi:MAG: hypothetical protein LBS05_09255 [Tannerellaceae bacterium]|nr:hypothetical protein [Tannerellaceae bacterium]
MSETAVRVYIRKSHSYSWDVPLPRLSRKAGEERRPLRREKAEGKVKDETPVLHTLILYHSAAYILCEGVKDFSLKVYGECCVVLLLPSGINLLPSGINPIPSGINLFPSGNIPDGSETDTGSGGKILYTSRVKVIGSETKVYRISTHNSKLAT